MRELKAQGAGKEAIAPQVQRLLELKEKLGVAPAKAKKGKPKKK